MLIARVQGHIVSTAKTPAYVGHKILRVVPENWDGSPSTKAAPVVALDLVDAGIGDRVLVCQEGGWARQVIGDMNAPVRSMVVAVVEALDVREPNRPRPPSGIRNDLRASFPA